MCVVSLPLALLRRSLSCAAESCAHTAEEILQGRTSTQPFYVQVSHLQWPSLMQQDNNTYRESTVLLHRLTRNVAKDCDPQEVVVAEGNVERVWEWEGPLVPGVHHRQCGKQHQLLALEGRETTDTPYNDTTLSMLPLQICTCACKHATPSTQDLLVPGSNERKYSHIDI